MAKRTRKGKLPAFWQRITRPESKRAGDRTRSEESKEERSREADRTRGWGTFHTKLRELKRETGFDILNAIKSGIGNFTEDRPFKVFDLGCGGGIALGQLKKKFGTRIKTVGLVFERTPGQKYNHVDRLIIGNVKKVQPKESYDLIYSFQGAIAHIEMKTTALERVIAWLKPGGTAVLDIGELHLQDSRLGEIKTLLMQNGIKDYKLDVLRTYRYSRSETPCRVLIFKKPVRKLP